MEFIKNQIDALVQEKYINPAAFDTFASELLNLGIERLTFDNIKDEMSFYTKNKFVHSLIRTDLKEAQKKTHWKLGDKFDISKLECALKQLDEGKLSVPEFHREIFAAGVVFCNVYLTSRKVYYMALDGDYYLENY